MGSGSVFRPRIIPRLGVAGQTPLRRGAKVPMLIVGRPDRATGRRIGVFDRRRALCAAMRQAAIGDRTRRDVHESRWTSTSKPFGHARRFLKAFAARQGAELGRAKLVRLPAGHRV